MVNSPSWHNASDSVDLSAWADVEAMSLLQAACLWAGVLPPTYRFQLSTAAAAAVAPRLAMLNSAADSGEMPTDARQNALASFGDHERSIVTREALRAIAARRGLRPSFLFPTPPPVPALPPEAEPGAWWTIPQAVAWLVTRDIGKVVEAREVATLGGLDRLALHPASCGDEPPTPRKAAPGQIIKAARKRQIEIHGLARGNSNPTPVPVWLMIDPQLTDMLSSGARDGGLQLMDSTYMWRDCWSDLTVRREDICSLWPERSEPRSPEPAVVAPTAGIPARRSKAIPDDDAMLEILHKERLDGDDGFSLRAAILAHKDEIVGNSDEAKVRRLTRKYGDRYPD